MPRNNKGLRFLKNRSALERVFSRPFPKFDEAWTILYLFITGSDTLSRRNILFAESYAYKLRDNPDWQQDPLNLDRMERIDKALRNAKDRLVYRESKRDQKKEVEARKEIRKARNEPPPVPAPEVDPSILWKKWNEERESKKHE